jgi:post-segregation antitoxin (ccd killing protein)
MKTEVYSWRLSPDLKSDLLREARARQVPVAKLIETAVRDFIDKSAGESSRAEEQARIHAAAAKFIGVIKGDDPYRSQRVRELVRERLSQRYGR